MDDERSTQRWKPRRWLFALVVFPGGTGSMASFVLRINRVIQFTMPIAHRCYCPTVETVIGGTEIKPTL